MVQVYSQSFGLPGVTYIDSGAAAHDLYYAGFQVLEEAVISSITPTGDSITNAGKLAGVTLPAGFVHWVPFRSIALTSGLVAVYKQHKTFRGHDES